MMTRVREGEELAYLLGDEMGGDDAEMVEMRGNEMRVRGDEIEM